MNHFRKIPAFLLGAVLLLAGCGSMNVDKVLPDKQVEYKRETVADKHLEVPPDLTAGRIDHHIPGLGAGGSASYSDYARARQSGLAGGDRGVREVLPEVPDVRVMRDGRDRWLVIEGSPQSVWDKVVDFWQENGILLDQLDPQVGVMETTWLENKADVPNDFITDFIQGFFPGAYGAATRDRFRVRLEEGEEPGTTEVYLTHFGMEQDFARNGSGEEDQIYWKIRPRDPGLEEIMLRKIMVFMGLDEARAKAKLAESRELQGVRSRIEKTTGQLSLYIEQPFDRAWRSVGMALDRIGFMVEDRDRSVGTYWVRYRDPTAGSKQGGWLSKLAFWKRDTPVDEEKLYRIRLEAVGEATRMTIHDEEGKPLTDDTAQRILVMVQEQLSSR